MKLPWTTQCASPLEEVINQPVYTSQAAALSSDAVHPTAGTSNLVVIETPVPVEDRRDYLNFALPSFGCYEELLSRGTPISGPVQRAIVDKLFQECFKLAWYSSRELYRTAAERLVQTYPHLADKLGAKTSGLESWVLSLRNKFKNMWKKVENCPPEMAEKRAQSLHKRPRQPQGDVLNKKLCRLFITLYSQHWNLQRLAAMKHFMLFCWRQKSTFVFGHIDSDHLQAVVTRQKAKEVSPVLIGPDAHTQGHKLEGVVL
ncbi:hypothetical protein MRX96_024956 [Rhipicephalus microplus]